MMSRLETGPPLTPPHPLTVPSRRPPTTEGLTLLSGLTSVQAYAEAVLEACLREVNGTAGSVMFLAREDTNLQVVAARGPGSDALMGHRLALGAPIAGRVAEQKEPLWVPDVSQEADFSSNARRYARAGRSPVGSCISVPLVWSGQVVGVLNVSGDDPHALTADDCARLSGAAPGMARCVQMLRLGEAGDDSAVWGDTTFHPMLHSVPGEAVRAGGPVLDLVDQAMVFFDGGGHLTRMNRCAAGLFGQAHAGTRTLGSLPLRVSTGTWTAFVEMGLANGHFPPLQDIAVDGGQPNADRVLKCHGSVLRDAAGAVAGGCLVFEDYTRTVQLAQQAQAAKKRSAMGELLSEIVHELNSPLDSTRRLLRLAQRQHSDPDAVAEHMADAMKATDRMVGIVTELLAFSRSESSTANPMPLRQVLDAYFQELSATGRYPRVRFVRDYRGLGPVIPCTDFTAIIDNLVRNACDAMDHQGTVVLYGQARENTYVLEVQDTGSGVPDELQERIFEPFFSTKAYGKGTGLGLALCRKILEPHGGTLTCASQSGIGTTFRIVLPLAAPESTHHAGA